MTAARNLGPPIHALFQVSTPGALVTQIHCAVLSVHLILKHGNFGLYEKKFDAIFDPKELAGHEVGGA